MIKLDKTTATLLPLVKSRGTTAQRLQHATDMNLRFYRNLKYDFNKDRLVTSAQFKQNLLATIGQKLTMRVIPGITNENVMITRTINSKEMAKGYTMHFPKDRWTDRNVIPQSSAHTFLQTTQDFFTYLLNPKFFAREVDMFNKKQNLRGSVEFYENNIANTQELKNETLEKFLAGKSPSEIINSLQLLRYRLMANKNANEAKAIIGREIAKTEHMQYNPRKYDFSAYNYDTKLEILNEKLREILEKTRDRIHKGLL